MFSLTSQQYPIDCIKNLKLTEISYNSFSMFEGRKTLDMFPCLFEEDSKSPGIPPIIFRFWNWKIYK